jgi:hypothetical protein
MVLSKTFKEKMMSRLLKKSVYILLLAYTGLSLFMSCSPAPHQQRDDTSMHTSEDTTSVKGDTTVQPAEDTTTNVVDNTTVQPAEDVGEYWTEERMRKAKPRPFPEAVIPEDGNTTNPNEGLPSDAGHGNVPGQAPGSGQQSSPAN